MFLYTPTCRTIFCLYHFVSLLSANVHLLPQINLRKNMRTALFYVVCALPVFIITYKTLPCILKILSFNIIHPVAPLDGDDERTCSPRLVACISTLHLFCKVKPKLLVRHATTLQPYLDIRCIVSNQWGNLKISLNI